MDISPYFILWSRKTKKIPDLQIKPQNKLQKIETQKMYHQRRSVDDEKMVLMMKKSKRKLS